MDERPAYRITDAAQLGNALAALRVSLGWTQGELSSWSGLNRTYLSRLERGEPTLALRRFMRIVNTLGYELTLTPKPSAREGLEGEW